MHFQLDINIVERTVTLPRTSNDCKRFDILANNNAIRILHIQIGEVLGGPGY